MAVDYSKLSTEDLLALKSGDYSKVSTEGLLQLKNSAMAGSGASSDASKPVQGTPPPPIGLNQVLDAAKAEAASGTPLNNAPKNIQTGADLAGNMAEKLGIKAGFDPAIAKGVGMLGKATPTAMSMVDPLSAGNIPGKAASKLAARAGGLGKMFNQTDSARRWAEKAGRDALTHDLVPKLGNPRIMDARVGALEGKVGAKLGDIRDAAGKQPVDNVLSAIESSRSKLLNGAKGEKGLYKAINNKVDELRDTIYDLMPDYKPAQPARTEANGLVDASGKAMVKEIPALPEKTQPLSVRQIIGVKKRIADSVNWLATNAGQADAKALAMALESGVEETLKQAGTNMPQYKALKSLYGSLKLLNKGLDKELAGLAGNSPVSARALLTGSLFSGGNPVQGAVVGGIAETVKRRGAGVGANVLHGAQGAAAPVAMPAAMMEAYDRLMARRGKK